MANQPLPSPDQHLALNALRFIVVDVVWELLYLPIWWYSRGIVRMLRMVRDKVAELVDTLALPILIRYIGKPMFGDYTRSGRAISLVIRIIQIVIFSVIVGVYSIVLGILFLLWLAAPIYVTYQITYQMLGPLFQ